MLMFTSVIETLISVILRTGSIIGPLLTTFNKFPGGKPLELETDNVQIAGEGGDLPLRDGIYDDFAANMSVCLENSSVLTNPVGTSHSTNVSDVSTTVASSGTAEEKEEKPTVPKNVTKIIVANSQAAVASCPTSVLQKVVNSPLITVVNAPGPITVVKTSLGSTSAPHFTLVNPAPLNVKSASTITLLNAPPITVVKAVSGSTQSPEQNKLSDSSGTVSGSATNNGSVTPVAEKTPLHNVFVKKAVSNEDVPQSHKLLTANCFPANNMMQNPTLSGSTIKTVNGQKPVCSGKVKILSNVVMPSNLAGPSNVLLNKSNTHRFFQQKNIGNGTAKHLSKFPINNMKTMPTKKLQDKTQQQRLIYPTHKSHIKTLPAVNNYISKSAGIKTLSPQSKTMPSQVHKTGCGLRTIPPQRPSKPASKPNYIGKHAVQAQKLRQCMPKVKSVKPPVNSYHNRTPQTSQMTFNQALTAQILETLGRDSSRSSNYEGTSCYDSSYNYCEPRMQSEQQRTIEYKPQSNLDTLSFVCQAVLLDHNYNATLPADISSTPSSAPTQSNGITSSSLYSPGSGKRSRCNLTPSNTLSSLSSSTLLQSSTSQDDDAASDISCPSDRKPDTEGEETDTAPEAEAVANDEQFDRYGDYVTRCICGFIHDDGYMIECDQCKVWQHVRCVVRNKKVPDDYLCEECDPTKPADRQKARILQQQWMREVQEREARLRKEQMKESLSDSDSSDGEQALINNNNVTNKSRRKSEIRRQRRDSAKDKRQLKRKMTKRKLKPQLKSTSDDEKHQLPQLRQWIDNYEEAVTNHYSPELRARVSSIRINGVYSELSGQIDPQVQKCKVQVNISGLKHLTSTTCMPSGTAVIELRGKYMLSTQHRTSNHTGSLTTRQQRPGPFLFFYRLQKDNTEVCVDTRTYGNIARFIRRSCQPNAELRHCIEKGVLHLYIVTISAIDKNVELTIKHESHDLAAVGTTDIPCACGTPDMCHLNKSRKNGDSVTETSHRKRRGRRSSSISADCNSNTPVKQKEEPVAEDKPEVKLETPVKPEVKEEDEEINIKPEEPDVKEEPAEVKPVLKTEVKVKKEEENESSSSPPPPPPPPPPPVCTRRSSHKNDLEEKKELPVPEEKEKNKKLSREERKLQAIMKAIERMEKQEQRKQEHQAKQAHRRESEPNPHRDDEKNTPRAKRRKRKGRTRTLSTNSQAGRRNRLNSSDSIHATSSDDTLLSPTDQPIDQGSPSKAAGLLMALANGDALNRCETKSPDRLRDIDSNSNSSPETPLSSACLLVAAAVEPLEPGFKFPKTKKGLMNEWLNKGTDLVQSASSISPSSLTAHITPTETAVYDTATGFYAPSKNLVALAQAATYCDTSQPRASAKKRWLRQAISEDQCDSPNSRPDSPPVSDMVAPPKKRRLPRESLSSEISPPSTPTNNMSVSQKNEEPGVEIITSRDSDSPNQLMESDTTLNELAAEMKHEYGSCIHLPEPQENSRKEVSSLLDPRLSRERPSLFSSSEHLVGTVEKTLSFLGFEDRKPELITPAKRKLSITEYRQRKKLNDEKVQEETITEESNSSQSPKHMRNRSNSSSSATSYVSSDDEMTAADISGKVISGFNSEPTELERQRESVSLRLKKAFGLSVDDDSRKTALNVENILKCDLPSPVKTSIPLSSPTFPIPGSSDSAPLTSPVHFPDPSQSHQIHQPDSVHQDVVVTEKSAVENVLYYTPDEEEIEVVTNEPEKIEGTSYVPPFNNPLYPNSSYTTFGSVIDDDAPYEGRNPSPPPNLSSVP